MDSIVVTGDLDPLAALQLRSRLATATAELRPVVEIDLTDVQSVHVAGTAALISAARRAQQQGGEVRIIAPKSPKARQELGLTSWFPPGVIHDPARP